MYNAELKTKFINQYSDSIAARKYHESTFNLLEKYEEEWGSDICTRKEDEIKPVLDKILGLRQQGRIAKTSMLRTYAKWCLEQEVDGACDAMLNVDIEDLQIVREQMVNSPLHLQKYMDILFTKEDMKTMDNVTRCFLWLAYGGVPEDEITDVNIDDVDLGNMTIKLNDKEYPIYRESLQAFKNCIDLDYFVYYHPNYSKEILRERVPGKQLLRGIKAEAQIRLLRVEVSKKARKAIADGKTNARLSYYRVWLSGLYYKKYQLELVGTKPDFLDVAEEFMQGKTYNLSSGRNLIGSKQRRVAKQYKDDYERWKLAFFS